MSPMPPPSAPPKHQLWQVTALASLVVLLAGCAQLPGAGPSGKRIDQASAASAAAAVQVVDVDDSVTRQLQALQQQRLFSDSLGQQRAGDAGIGAGDALEIQLWEAPPATLFGGGVVDARNPSTARALVLPEQTVDREGFISVPFAGRIRAAGLSAAALETEIMRLLKGKANQPEAMVRMLRNGSALVTVVGEVNTSLRMPITPAGERLLDALAAAGGVRQPVNKMTLQVTRGSQYHSMPLDRVIRDPQQNVPLRAGDVVTALFQPLSFTALGATGKNEEINFEAQGINLAQALARSGGLQDARADAQGVFVFRLESASALAWATPPSFTASDGRVPVVYRVNLREPRSFFVIQDFMLRDKDIVYVSNAQATELQKFLNLVFSVAYPVLNTVQVLRNN